MLRGFATVSFYAADLHAAREWYTELLGIEPYFAVPDFDNPGYLEYRFGDLQCELGIIDAKYARHQVADGPAGAIIHWHVDDLEATFERSALPRRHRDRTHHRTRQQHRLPHRVGHRPVRQCHRHHDQPPLPGSPRRAEELIERPRNQTP